jgi:rod shape-determining protein MreD
MTQAGNIWAYTQRGLRLSVAHILLLMLFCAELAPLGFPGSNTVNPFFLIMGVYYWAVFRPTLIPPFYLFLLGIAMDCLTFMPAGSHAAIYLLIYWIVRMQRRYLMGQPFNIIYSGFLLVATVYAVLMWSISALYYMQLISPLPVLGHLVFSVLLFPFMILIFVMTHRILPGTRSSKPALMKE